MFAAQTEQDLLCRVFGNCLAGDLHRPRDRRPAVVQGRSSRAEALHLLRYDAELTREGLDALGFPKIEPETVRKLDFVDGIDDLWEVGSRSARRSSPSTSRASLRADQGGLHEPPARLVIMPFGKKKLTDGTEVDCDDIYKRLPSRRSRPLASSHTGPTRTAAAARSISTCSRTCCWRSLSSPT